MRERIVLYGGSFNPPKIADRKIAQTLSYFFDRIFIIPCGTRKDKATTDASSARHRMEMVKIAFNRLKKVKFDFYDIETDIFTPTYKLQEKYQNLFPNAEIWHLIGEDIAAGGRMEKSEIHRIWDHGHEIWNNLNFLVIARPGYGARQEDLPPHHQTLTVEGIVGSGTLIRKRVANDLSINKLVDPDVEEYIKKNKLYQKK